VRVKKTQNNTIPEETKTVSETLPEEVTEALIEEVETMPETLPEEAKTVSLAVEKTSLDSIVEALDSLTPNIKSVSEKTAIIRKYMDTITAAQKRGYRQPV
jgi:hypothetical protein